MYLSDWYTVNKEFFPDELVEGYMDITTKNVVKMENQLNNRNLHTITCSYKKKTDDENKDNDKDIYKGREDACKIEEDVVPEESPNEGYNIMWKSLQFLKNLSATEELYKKARKEKDLEKKVDILEKRVILMKQEPLNVMGIEVTYSDTSLSITQEGEPADVKEALLTDALLIELKLKEPEPEEVTEEEFEEEEEEEEGELEEEEEKDEFVEAKDDYFGEDEEEEMEGEEEEEMEIEEKKVEKEPVVEEPIDETRPRTLTKRQYKKKRSQNLARLKDLFPDRPVIPKPPKEEEKVPACDMEMLFTPQEYPKLEFKRRRPPQGPQIPEVEMPEVCPLPKLYKRPQEYKIEIPKPQNNERLSYFLQRACPSITRLGIDEL